MTNLASPEPKSTAGNLRAVLVCVAKFHLFDLARQLERFGALERIYTGYPMFKLRDEGVPEAKIVSKPFVQSLYMRRGKLGLRGPTIGRQLAWWAHEVVDRAAARTLPECDLVFGLSGSALAAGLKGQSRGAKYICDRGSCHIELQDELLREEHRLHGVPYPGIDPRAIEKHQREYQAADAITVPSKFAADSYLARGFEPAKIKTVMYGVNLGRFEKVADPDPDRFDVLYVGGLALQKGLPYLIQAFKKVNHPKKKLTLIGGSVAETPAILAMAAGDPTIEAVGTMPQTELKNAMSRSHVLVLPSIQDGFGMVVAQAMACGCPVIGTANTGVPDIVDEGVEGFVVPIRDAEAIALKLQELAEDRSKRDRMGAAALARVQKLGGWDTYGDEMMRVFEELVGVKV